MEIDITRFLQDAAPMDYSASVAEIGSNAGSQTWGAAVDDSPDFNFLDDNEKRQAWRDYVKGFGAWNAEEIAAWSDREVNALFLQFISGDLREMGFNRPGDSIDWEDIRAKQEEGTISSSIYRGDDGLIYAYVGD